MFYQLFSLNSHSPTSRDCRHQQAYCLTNLFFFFLIMFFMAKIGATPIFAITWCSDYNEHCEGGDCNAQQGVCPTGSTAGPCGNDQYEVCETYSSRCCAPRPAVEESGFQTCPQSEIFSPTNLDLTCGWGDEAFGYCVQDTDINGSQWYCEFTNTIDSLEDFSYQDTDGQTVSIKGIRTRCAEIAKGKKYMVRYEESALGLDSCTLNETLGFTAFNGGTYNCCIEKTAKEEEEDPVSSDCNHLTSLCPGELKATSCEGGEHFTYRAETISYDGAYPCVNNGISYYCCKEYSDAGWDEDINDTSALTLNAKVTDLQYSSLLAINPLKNSSEFKDESSRTPGNIINRALTTIVFPIAGYGLLILILWSGFQILTGSVSGKQNSIDIGKKRLTTAIIGFVILLLVYWIWRFLTVATGLMS